ncbi:diguanylate cyclase domain-containing protein [Dapis sp. BLCC M126]|uniref:diguanylate cyclase domain-containing protein n=1 Tax=Dapis sp. BLCC M126 TaxID=3400189 RepID=UPI003CF7671C
MMKAVRWKLLKLCKLLYQLLYTRVIIILVTLLCLGFGIALAGTYYLSINLVDSQAMHYAKVAVKTLNEARILYSKNVVDRIKSMNGIVAIAEYHTVKGGIPNPATYTIELGERLSDESEGMLFRLYSNYPFPNRQLTGGPQDKFEWDALTYLTEHPEASFYRKEQLGDRLSFRYTEAVLMEPSCVACHNTLRNSPRKDWKVGQLRGIVEITQPVDDIMLIAEDGLKVIYTVLMIIIALAISGLILVIGRFRTINQELEQKIVERTAALNHLATIDELTQLVNRRQFNLLLQQEWRRMQRQQQPLSLILCDVDHFKKYNDTYGHPAGDNCLRAVAQVLDSSVKRSGEFAARYGGEEFAIVLPGVNSLEATRVATIIMDAIHCLKIPHKTSLNHSYVTLSMGIASTIPNDKNSSEQLIKSADLGLYQAKEEGRDRFIIWNERQQ